MAASGYRFANIRAKIIESARRCNGNSDDCAMNALCLFAAPCILGAALTP